MHFIIKHIVSNIGISLFLIFSILIGSNAYSEQSAEDIIKERKALFSKNYKTAKRVQALSAKGEFDKAKEKYNFVVREFPDNTASSLALQLLKNME